MAKSKELTKTAPQPPAIVERPSYIDDSSEGLENIRPQDIVLPRLVLMQALSPLVNDENRYQAGDMVNSLTQELIAPKDQELVFIPFYHFVSWIRWGDRKKGEGLLAQSLDPKSELAQSAAAGVKVVRGDKEVFDVTEYHNFITVLSPIVNEPEVLMIPFSKSTYKIGRKLLGLVRLRGSVPLYASRFALSVTNEHNRQANSSYKGLNVRNDGWANEDEYMAAKTLYTIINDGFKNNVVKYDVSDEEPIEADTSGEF